MDARGQVGPVVYSGFPVRSLTKRLSGEASDSGEWITAYRAEQKKRLRAVLSLSTCLRETKRNKEQRTASRSVSGDREGSPVLDMRFLLSHCCIKNPRDLCVCHIDGMGLRGYKTTDLASFDNVIYINASENELPLEPFKAFALLQELELSLNGIVDISISQKDFNRLQCLDLSYNSVSTLAVLSLGELPTLRELRLTGNDIVTLPVEFSRPVQMEGNESAMKIRYPALETLWLDDNKLCDQVTFATLAGLRKLRYLNMDNNEIYHIPQLKLLGTSPMKAAAKNQDDRVKDRQEDGGNEDGSGHDSSHVIKGVNNDVMLLPTTSDHGLTREPVTVKSEGTPSSTNLGQVTSDDGERNTTMAPFPNLETLSLAHNLLLSDESLVACAEWPMLKELVIYGNPITRVSRGVPPLLQAKLMQGKGIKIVRHKPHLKDRHIAGKAAKHFIAISTAPPPTIPKQLIALQDPSNLPLALDQAPMPSSLSQSEHSSSSIAASSEQDKPTDHGSEENRKGPGVFMTQGHSEDSQDLPPPPSTVQVQPSLPTVAEEFEAWKRDAAIRHKDAPARYKGFEVLLDTCEEASLPLIYDIKSCSQALRHALKHPLMLPSTNLSRPPTTGNYLTRKGPAKPTRPQSGSRVTELRQILHDMRERSSLVEASLSTVLKGKPHKGKATPESKESKRLLDEMQVRYKQVRTASLKDLEPISEVRLSSFSRDQH